MFFPPPEVIASWPTPNYKNPKTQGLSIIYLDAILLAICVVVVAVRLYIRIFVKNWFGLDDILICFALVFTVLQNVYTNIGALRYGWDRHAWDIPLSWISPSLKTALLSEVFFIIGSHFTACSLLAFYYRLGRATSKRWFKIALYATAIWFTIFSLLFLFLIAFQCSPVDAAWAFPPKLSARCLDMRHLIFSGSCYKILIDVVITTLPIPLILRLDMPRRQRYGVVALLACGYAVTVAGIVRSYYAYQALYTTWDTWRFYPAYLSGSIEIHLSVICACVPAVRIIFARVYVATARLFGANVGWSTTGTYASDTSTLPMDSIVKSTTISAERTITSSDVEQETMPADESWIIFDEDPRRNPV